VLRILHDQASRVLGIPRWATQRFFTIVLQLLIYMPRVLKASAQNLINPPLDSPHPLHQRLDYSSAERWYEWGNQIWSTKRTAIDDRSNVTTSTPLTEDEARTTTWRETTEEQREMEAKTSLDAIHNNESRWRNSTKTVVVVSPPNTKTCRYWRDTQKREGQHGAHH